MFVVYVEPEVAPAKYPLIGTPTTSNFLNNANNFFVPIIFGALGYQHPRLCDVLSKDQAVF